MPSLSPRALWTELLANLRVQVGLCALVYLASLARFVAVAEGVTEGFTALARGPYLGAAVLAQLRVLPAYAVVALGAAVLSLPLVLRTAGPAARPARRAAHVLAWDLLLALLALGPILRAGAGLFDTFARKLPRLDLYAVQRWHLLEALAVLVACAAALAALVWVRAFWREAPRRFALVAAPALVAVAALGLRGTPVPRLAAPPPRPNVLVLATDSWRHDRVGVHGAARPGLTPNVDRFARDAVDFDQLHVATGSTLESWVTFLTGQFPPTHGIRSMYPGRDEVAKVEANPDRLPALLAAAGYQTFVSSDWAGNCFDLLSLGFSHQRVGKVQNFEALLLEATVQAHPLVGLFFGAASGPLVDLLVPGRGSLAAAARPEVLTESLFDGIDRSVEQGRPFFGVLFTSPTHLPYNARYPFNTRYVAPGYDGPHRYQVEVSAHELITTGFARTLPPETVQHLRDLYDGAVSDFDDTVGQVLAGLAARGLDRHTIVVLTSDHGEDLYDPGSTLGHGTNFFGGDQSTRVPFLVRVPEGQGWLRPGARVGAVARNADFAPTVLELVGLPVPASCEGVSLVPLLRGEVDDLALPAFAETCYLFFPKAQAMTSLTGPERAQVVELSGASDTLTVDPDFRHNLVLKPEWRAKVVQAKDRMVRTRRWKLIEIPGKTAPIRRLYDLHADPAQTADLAGRGLPEERALASLLERYWAGEARSLRTDLGTAAQASTGARASPLQQP